VTNKAGTAIEEESDYYPFGGERTITDSLADQNYKFTGKQRDSETNLDYFGARYYAFNFGRFITPDKPFADQNIPDPQSWNLYAYTRNNPLRFVDDTGEGTRPAQAKFINDALSTDPTLRAVILNSNNFSPGGFEDAYLGGHLSNLNTGQGNTLRGLAGEATVIDDINRNLVDPGAAYPAPRNLTGVFPDVGVQLGHPLLPGGFILPNIASASGGLGNVKLQAFIVQNYLEVKSGLSASTVAQGVDQAIATAGALKKAGLGGSAISTLVVDAGVWASLSPSQRATLVSRAQAGGAYIQVQTGLAEAARKRAEELVNQARKKQRQK